jgi:xylulokinase
MSYVIGVDSSTTATKAVVWNREGRAVADGRAEFPLALPRPGWHEQDAEDWWRSTAAAVRRALQSVDASEIEAIGLTHQRETFACLDEQGRAVRPAIVWMDVRATGSPASQPTPRLPCTSCSGCASTSPRRSGALAGSLTSTPSSCTG